MLELVRDRERVPWLTVDGRKVWRNRPRIGTGFALGSARMKGENDAPLDAVDADAGA